MATAIRKDKYSNKAVKKITMSAANTLTFQQLDFNIPALSSIGMIIQRIDWHLHSLSELVAAADQITIALVTSNQLSSIEPEDPAVLAQIDLFAQAAPAEVHVEPTIMDFSSLAGGGLIVSPARLYIAMVTTGFTGAGIAVVVLFHTLTSLSDREAIELLQTHLPTTV